MDRKNIGFIGAGNMAQAIIKGLVNSPLKKKLSVSAYDVNSKLLGAVCSKLKIKKASSNIEMAKKSGILFLAVKPQAVAEVLGTLKGVVTKNHLIISIAAGISISKIQLLLGVKCPVVRVMPNTPALVGEGAAGYSFSYGVSVKDKKISGEILSSFCKVMVGLPEEDINIVTAISGSGPAYVFYFAEAMLKAAAELGFDAVKAKELIIQTFIGSAKLMKDSKDTPELLRQKVTSKGGTTEKAISIMDAAGVLESIRIAVKSAKAKADELGK